MGVRLANQEDVRAMSRIHSQTWKKAYVNYISPEYLENISDEGWIPLFARAFKEKLHEAAVFELDGEITGTVTFGPGRAIDGQPENITETSKDGEIISLYVLPEYWSTKQGYELIKFAVDSLKVQGYKGCYLWVIKENERATSFYKRFGFKATGELMTVMMAGLPLIEQKYILCF